MPGLPISAESPPTCSDALARRAWMAGCPGLFRGDSPDAVIEAAYRAPGITSYSLADWRGELWRSGHVVQCRGQAGAYYFVLPLPEHPGRRIDPASPQ